MSGLRAYAGGHPTRVSGQLLAQEHGVDLRFSGEILFDDGVLGQFFVAMDVPGGAQLDIQGDGGRLRMTNAFRTAAEWGDLEPYFEGAVVFVEWPEAGSGALPRPRAAVRLAHLAPERRLVTIEAEPGTPVADFTAE